MKRLAIHVETNETINIDGETKKIKPHIHIEEDELLEFVKNRSRKWFDDEGEWENVNALNILSVSLESIQERPETESVEDLIGISDIQENAG